MWMHTRSSGEAGIRGKPGIELSSIDDDDGCTGAATKMDGSSAHVAATENDTPRMESACAMEYDSCSRVRSRFSQPRQRTCAQGATDGDDWRLTCAMACDSTDGPKARRSSMVPNAGDFHEAT